MGTLADKIRADLTESMKARDAARTSTLRMLQASIKNDQIDKGHDLTDEEVQAVLHRAVKQRQDSIEQYTKGNRKDLADKEAAELEMLRAYLPEQFSEEDTERIIREIVAEIGAESKKDSGRVMKEIMARHRGKVDGKKVQEIVGRILP